MTTRTKVHNLRNQRWAASLSLLCCWALTLSAASSLGAGAVCPGPSSFWQRGALSICEVTQPNQVGASKSTNATAAAPSVFNSSCRRPNRCGTVSARRQHLTRWFGLLQPIKALIGSTSFKNTQRHFQERKVRLQIWKLLKAPGGTHYSQSRYSGLQTQTHTCWLQSLADTRDTTQTRLSLSDIQDLKVPNFHSQTKSLKRPQMEALGTTVTTI